MTIIGVVGAIGSGKSFTQLRTALEFANLKGKGLVFNFRINRQALIEYCSLPAYADKWYGDIAFSLDQLRYVFLFHRWFLFPKRFPCPKRFRPVPRLPWVRALALNDRAIYEFPNVDNFQDLLLPNTVACIDECGVFLNSREFSKTPKELLADLAQSRKFGCDLIWCGQFDQQVDKQFRLLTQYFIHCSSMTLPDRETKRPKLFWKKAFWFTADSYWEWVQNPKYRNNFLLTSWSFSMKSESGMLTLADRKLFEVFNSFDRLDLDYDRGNRLPSKKLLSSSKFVSN